ncbi:MAG: phosphonate ABC transporter, permease protein PhnE [Candidatus Kapabacteria bacterium]|jgi:phosphonate transport system permease protein|nr:phosphonate ABC transporter, permease protein PhnE [Candidatus Kapabacteria bacterium]
MTPTAAQIIERRNRRERIKSMAAALFTDALLGIYLVLLLHRALWFGVLYPVDAAPELTRSLLVLYCVVGVVVGLVLNFLNASPGRMIFGFFDNPDAVKVRGTWREAAAQHFSWIVVILTVVAAWIVTKISIADLFSSEGVQGARRIFTALFTPEFSIFEQAFLAIIETIYLALMATVLALPFSFALSFFCAENCVEDIFGGHWAARALYYGLRFMANLARSIEPLIWAIVFSVWVGIGPFAGMLALAVHTVASLVKQYSEQIEEIDHGTVEAIESVGAAPFQVIWFAVVPQIMLPFLSFTIYRWDINVRMATVIGLVGGGGIGTLLVQYQGLAKWHEVGLIILLIASVVWIMDYLSSKIRAAIR